MNSSTIVSFRQASLKISGKTLLDQVSLEIPAGQLVAIIGPNGAGKSTLLKTLTGIQNLSSGQVEVLGRQVTSDLKRREIRDLRAQIGQVFQGLHLVPRLTVLENVLIGRLSFNRSFRTWARVYSDEDHSISLQAMNRVGISHKAQERVDRLSGGERQKVAIARALAQKTNLLLADEPTSNLDPQSALEIARLLKDLAQEQKITILTVVHDLSLLPVLGGRVLGMKAGKLVLDLDFSSPQLKNKKSQESFDFEKEIAAIYRSENG